MVGHPFFFKDLYFLIVYTADTINAEVEREFRPNSLLQDAYTHNDAEVGGGREV